MRAEGTHTRKAGWLPRRQPAEEDRKGMGSREASETEEDPRPARKDLSYLPARNLLLAQEGVRRAEGGRK